MPSGPMGAGTARADSLSSRPGIPLPEFLHFADCGRITQPGSYRLGRWVSTDKRPCME
jgi:hypothetical protein